jgi:hypothetical protein
MTMTTIAPTGERRHYTNVPFTDALNQAMDFAIQTGRRHVVRRSKTSSHLWCVAEVESVLA